VVGTLALVGVAMVGGCQTGNASSTSSDASFSTATADSDRAHLVKLVGEWQFEGSWSGADGKQNAVQGRAAGVLVNNYFVMLDVQTTSGELAGRTTREDGSMIFAAEPGVGMTVTAWGDASPTVTRLVGRTEQGGNVFNFVPAGGTANAAALIVRFDGPDRFTTQLNPGAVLSSANYTFTRVK
jgi:hypothetical protein